MNKIDGCFNVDFATIERGDMYDEMGFPPEAGIVLVRENNCSRKELHSWNITDYGFLADISLYQFPRVYGMDGIVRRPEEVIFLPREEAKRLYGYHRVEGNR